MYSSFWHHWWFISLVFSCVVLLCILFILSVELSCTYMYLHDGNYNGMNSGSTCRDSPRGMFWYFPLLLLSHYTSVSGTVMS